MGGNPQAGIEVGDTLIFVVDLVDVQLAGPKGSTVQPKAGLPTVRTRVASPRSPFRSPNRRRRSRCSR